MFKIISGLIIINFQPDDALLLGDPSASFLLPRELARALGGGRYIVFWFSPAPAADEDGAESAGIVAIGSVNRGVWIILDLALRALVVFFFRFGSVDQIWPSSSSRSSLALGIGLRRGRGGSGSKDSARSFF